MMMDQGLIGDLRIGYWVVNGKSMTSDIRGCGDTSYINNRLFHSS